MKRIMLLEIDNKTSVYFMNHLLATIQKHGKHSYFCYENNDVDVRLTRSDLRMISERMREAEVKG